MGVGGGVGGWAHAMLCSHMLSAVGKAWLIFCMPYPATALIAADTGTPPTHTHILNSPPPKPECTP